MIIDENGTQLFTLTELSIKLGKHPKYFTQIKYRRPELFDEVKIVKIGQSLLISEQEAKKIIKRLRKF